jgi:hypothetical protein
MENQEGQEQKLHQGLVCEKDMQAQHNDNAHGADALKQPGPHPDMGTFTAVRIRFTPLEGFSELDLRAFHSSSPGQI